MFGQKVFDWLSNYGKHGFERRRMFLLIKISMTNNKNRAQLINLQIFVVSKELIVVVQSLVFSHEFVGIFSTVVSSVKLGMEYPFLMG